MSRRLSRRVVHRVWTRGVSLGALWFIGCAPLEPIEAAAPSEDAVSAAALDRGVGLYCPNGYELSPTVTGLWAFRIVTRSRVSGSLSSAQEEAVTRYGVASLCQDYTDVQGQMLVCEMALGRLYEAESDTCAAQRPPAALVAAMPAVPIVGELSSLGSEPTLALYGWEERWGLAPGWALPVEPAGLELLQADGLFDQDEDGATGVTLVGDSSVPTVSWAARRTEASWRVGPLAGDPGVAEGGLLTLGGGGEAYTAQSILGGPATRLLRGRSRGTGSSEALFYRADGLFGSALVDSNQDGVLTCREIYGWITAGVLPPPPAHGCGQR